MTREMGMIYLAFLVAGSVWIWLAHKGAERPKVMRIAAVTLFTMAGFILLGSFALMKDDMADGIFVAIVALIFMAGASVAASLAVSKPAVIVTSGDKITRAAIQRIQDTMVDVETFRKAMGTAEVDGRTVTYRPSEAPTTEAEAYAAIRTAQARLDDAIHLRRSLWAGRGQVT